MEILKGDDLKGMNVSAGGLVWVRRRNGSWWPGRIVNPDEIPAKCLVPKKNGTPIVLLGSEEGTVDWYNVERSKRIKAFHCGEFDECIERAKASMIQSKQRTVNSLRHVHRDDAIRHALELEKLYLNNGNQRLSPNRHNKKMSFVAKNLVKQKRKMKERNGVACSSRKFSKPEEICTNDLPQSAVSFQHPDKPLNFVTKCRQKKRWKDLYESEDDTAEGTTRMKDLQDLCSGMKMGGKSDMLATTKVNCTGLPSCFSSQNNSDINNVRADISPKKGTHTSLSSSRSILESQAHHNPKRRNRRRRALKKIWICSDKVNVPLLYQDVVLDGDSPTPGITLKSLKDLKSASKKTNFSVSDNSSLNCSGTSFESTSFNLLEKNDNVIYDLSLPPSTTPVSIDDRFSDGLVDVPVLLGERNAEGFYSTQKPSMSRKVLSDDTEKISIHSVQVCLVSQSSEGLLETCSTNSVTQANHIEQRIERVNSEMISEAKCDSGCPILNMNQSLESPDEDADQTSSCMDFSCLKEDVYNACYESLTSDNSGQLISYERLAECNMHEHQSMPTAMNNGSNKHLALTNRSLWSSKVVNPSYFSSSTQKKTASRDILKSTVQDHDSKKIGQIALSVSRQCPDMDLSSDTSVASTIYDVELKVQANYHGQRVPLVSLVSKLNGKAIIGYAIAVDILVDGSTEALLHSGGDLNSHGIKLLKKRFNITGKFHVKLGHSAKVHLPLQDKTSHHLNLRSPLLKRKSLGGRSGFSPRKIRRLSSITIDLKDEENGREFVVEKGGTSTVSCIPLRVVFSRLNEALSCLSRPSH